MYYSTSAKINQSPTFLKKWGIDFEHCYFCGVVVVVVGAGLCCITFVGGTYEASVSVVSLNTM